MLCIYVYSVKSTDCEGPHYVVVLPSAGVGIATGYGLEAPCKIFLFSTPSRPTLEPTQLPIQWVSGAVSLGYSGEAM
jgi:hypothetical protein